MLRRLLSTLYRCLYFLFVAAIDVAMYVLSACCRPLERPRRRHDIKHIAFQAYATHLAQFYQPVVEELLKMEHVCVHFIVLLHPHFAFAESRQLRTYARTKLGIAPHRIRWYWQTAWQSFDAVVYADVYARFSCRKTRHLLLTHGPGLQRRFLSRRPWRKSVANFDAVCVNGLYDAELLRTKLGQQLAATRLAATGLPFLDPLAGGKQFALTAYAASAIFTAPYTTILFAPHWTSLRSIRNAEDNPFHDVIESLLSLPINIIVKLHAGSLHRSLGGRVDWQAWLDRLKRFDRIYVDEDRDDRPALHYADIVVSDVSSRLLNAMLLGKPAVSYAPLHVAEDVYDRRRLALIRQGAFVAQDIAALQAILRYLQQDPRPHPDSARVARRCFAHHGTATQQVIQVIRQELELS